MAAGEQEAGIHLGLGVLGPVITGWLFLPHLMLTAINLFTGRPLLDRWQTRREGTVCLQQRLAIPDEGV